MAAGTVEKRSLSALGRMGVVAAMHGAIIFVIANSFGLVPHLAPPEPLVTQIIDEPQDHEVLPPPPDYRPPANDQAVVLPAPDVLPVTDDLIDGGITAELRPIDDIPGTAIGEDVPRVVMQAVRADPKYPLTQPPYPASGIRANREGAVDVEVFVQPNGRVGDARILTSSGFEPFDRATLDEARRNWRFLPATRAGEPLAQWHRLRVVFRLKTQ